MSERKNRAPARHKRLTVERGYFHTGNSGISVSMIEETENYDWDEQDRDWYNHHLEVRHSAFGAGSVFRTPIAGPAMCDYYIEAFTRLRDRMLSDPDYRIPSPFERYGDTDIERASGKHKQKHDRRSNDDHRIVDIANGLRREEVWSPDIVTGEKTSETRLLGHNYVDQETEKVVNYVAFGGRVVRDTSGVATYRAEDIGKTVEQALADADAAAEQALLDVELAWLKKNSPVFEQLPDEEKDRIAVILSEDREKTIAKNIALNHERKAKWEAGAQDRREAAEAAMVDILSEVEAIVKKPSTSPRGSYVEALMDENERLIAERKAFVPQESGATIISSERLLEDETEIALDEETDAVAGSETVTRPMLPKLHLTVTRPTLPEFHLKVIQALHESDATSSERLLEDETEIALGEETEAVAGIFTESVTRPMLPEFHLKVIQWLLDHDDLADILYDNIWHGVSSADLRANIIADGLEAPDTKKALTVRLNSNAADAFAKYFG
jgi:hypothetical protein